MQKLGDELAEVLTAIIKDNGWKLGKDIAVLCSTDGQHYGDYGWSYYDYHPFGCNAKGYNKSVELDKRLIDNYLSGKLESDKIHKLFSELVDQKDISNYKITWCGRFAVSFAANFANILAGKAENRKLTGYYLRHGTSLSDPWLPLHELGLGVTADANLHHFVSYISMGYK
jgi:hypothetical protein